MQAKAEITILLLNYKRSHNLPRIIDNLKSQTVPVNIFLWDNSGNSTFHDARIDLIFRTSENQGCSPRWLTALYAKTKYIMTHDDDFLIINPDTIEKIVQCLNEQENKKTIVGYEGVFVDINKLIRNMCNLKIDTGLKKINLAMLHQDIRISNHQLEFILLKGG
ncbi:MAG: glycosyltransferase family 2 protein [Hydrococcus sp. SU_1_0]|nr:glycosyltransferase family 2 protein [Hydrococcus sp. SU_1_0]